MPFRERVKRALGRSGSVSDGASLKKTNTTSSSVYTPKETLPKPKYRGPVDPKHKEKLDGFSFASSWRRKSWQSQYSPFGSRVGSRAPSRNNSITEARKFFHRGQSHVGKVMENADDSGDVANVGGTRNHSTQNPTDSIIDSTEHGDEDTRSGVQEGASFAHDHKPFTEAEVNNALQKSTTRRSSSRMATRCDLLERVLRSLTEIEHD